MEASVFWLQSSIFGRLFLLCGIIFSTHFSALGYETKKNYTGGWTDSNSWIGSAPGTSGISSNVTIYGNIDANSPISFNSGILTVNDTLVINGNLTLNNNADLTLGDGAVLIILGNMSVANKVDIAAGGTLIIEGDLTFSGSANQGSFTSDQDPAQVFVGGAVTLPSGPNPYNNFPVLECNTGDHESTQCNYGNLDDLKDSPIYQEISCGSGISGGSVDADQALCVSDDVTPFVNLSPADPGTFTYQWYISNNSNDPNSGTWTEISGASGLTYDHGTLNETSYFYRQATKGAGCTVNSNVITVTVFPVPQPKGIYHD